MYVVGASEGNHHTSQHGVQMVRGTQINESGGRLDDLDEDLADRLVVQHKVDIGAQIARRGGDYE